MHARLQQAAASGDGDEVEGALVEAFQQGFRPDDVPALVDLLGARWHTRHEDVVRALQQLKTAGAEGALERAAFDRRGFDTIDEGLAIARKCTWALAEIGSSEARDGLERLAGGADAEVAAFAQKRLDSWDAEGHRKGH